MGNSEQTRDRLIAAAAPAFCEAGYSSVSLRRIAKAAEVDVALVSRYFGGKRGLFEAVLEQAFDWPDLQDPDRDPIEVTLQKYANPATDALQVASTRMIVLNAGDPEVGDLVRARLRQKIFAPLLARLGGPQAAPNLAMLVAVVLGAATVRHILRLPGMAEQPDEAYADQLRHLMQAALGFEPPAR